MDELKKCVVLGCPDTKHKRHRFPNVTSNLEYFKKWTDVINNPVLKALSLKEIYNNFVICERHFTKECIVPGTNRCLSVRALPSLFMNTKLDTEINNANSGISSDILLATSPYEPDVEQRQCITPVHFSCSDAPVVASSVTSRNMDFIRRLQMEVVPKTKYRCQFPGCKNVYATNSKTPNKTFHSFPKNKDDNERWREVCKISPNNKSQSLVVCGDHFSAKDYNDAIHRRGRLRRFAKPSVIPQDLTNVFPVVEDNQLSKPFAALSTQLPGDTKLLVEDNQILKNSLNPTITISVESQDMGNAGLVAGANEFLKRVLLSSATSATSAQATENKKSFVGNPVLKNDLKFLAVRRVQSPGLPKVFGKAKDKRILNILKPLTDSSVQSHDQANIFVEDRYNQMFESSTINDSNNINNCSNEIETRVNKNTEIEQSYLLDHCYFAPEDRSESEVPTEVPKIAVNAASTLVGNKKGILRTLNVSKKNLTPREDAMYKIYRNAQSKIVKLQKALKLERKKYSDILALYKSKRFDFLDDQVSPWCKRLVHSNVALSKKHPNARRWTDEDKSFASSLYKESPRLYREFQKYFMIPSILTLKKSQKKSLNNLNSSATDEVS